MTGTRTAGPATWVAFAGCLVLSVVGLALRGAPWAGEWGWTLDVAADTTTLTAPVVATFAAWISYRWRGVRSIVDSSARGYLLPLDATATSSAVGLASLALAVVGGVAYSLATGTVGGPVPIVQFVPAVLILGVCAAAGALAGILVPHLLVIAICPFVTFVIASLGFAGIGPKLLRVGASTGGLGGVALRNGFVAAQVVGLLGLVALLVLLLLVTKRFPFPRAVLAVALGASVLALAAGSAGLLRDGERYVPSAESATACRRPSTGPTICSLPSHVRARDEVAPTLVRFVERLRAHGFDVPAAYSEPPLMPRGSVRDRGTLGLKNSSVELVGGDRAAALAADAAAQPAQCAFWSGEVPPPEEAYVATMLLADWIAVDAGYEVVAWSEQSQRWLDDRSVDKVGWAKTTYEALQACDVEGIRLPAGVGTR